jgi:hypothetical protein
MKIAKNEKRLRMNKTTGDHFMNKAKDILPLDVFKRILSDAHQEIANAGTSKS